MTMESLYGNKDKIAERHRHRYEVNPKYVKELEEAGLRFVGHDGQQQRMQVLELRDHPFFVATQYHPEYLSRPLSPSPPFLGLALASCGKLKSFLARGCRLSPPSLSDDEDETGKISLLSEATGSSFSNFSSDLDEELGNSIAKMSTE